MIKTIAIRAFSGAIFVALLLGSTLISELAISGVLAVAAFMGIQEIMVLINKNGKQCDPVSTMLSAAMLFSGFAIALTSNNFKFFFPLLALSLIAPFIVQLTSRKEPKFLEALVSAALPLYVGLPLILLVESASLDDYFQPYILIGIFILIWTYDTFAFLIGSWLGRTRLLPRVSPKKSIEGLVGGALVALGAAWVYAQYNQDLSLGHWLGIAVISVIFGTLGDLSESVLKRNYSVKDSGNVMPGHGGILDRFDALLFIGPAVYTFLVFVPY